MNGTSVDEVDGTQGERDLMDRRRNMDRNLPDCNNKLEKGEYLRYGNL